MGEPGVQAARAPLAASPAPPAAPAPPARGGDGAPSSSGSGDGFDLARPERERAGSESSRILRGDALRAKRRAALVATTVPAAGFVAACALAATRGWFGWADALNLGFFYLVSGFGITIGFHRLFTHKAFAAPTWLRAAFAIAGSMALEGPVLRWVADHRRHHACSDAEGDPHSPHHGFAGGWRARWRGLWHAHVGWLFAEDRSPVGKLARDLQKDPLIAWIDARYAWWVVLTLALPAAVGLALTETARGALSGFLWGGLARIFLVHHVTWSVNSICHCFGARPFETGDESANNWLLALPSLGEAWHNNHHAFPRAAVQGIGRFEVDPSGWVVRLLERAGVIREVERPAPEVVTRLRKAPGAPAG